jgi:hypothetical protein
MYLTDTAIRKICVKPPKVFKPEITVVQSRTTSITPSKLK